MSSFNGYTLNLKGKATPQPNFLTRQQLIEKNKKDKLQSNTKIQSRKIQKPQSVTKLSISKQSVKKIFSCSKLQIDELIPELSYCMPKNKNKECLNSDYFNFVKVKKKEEKNTENSQMNDFNKMKEELMKSFNQIEQMLF